MNTEYIENNSHLVEKDKKKVMDLIKNNVTSVWNYFYYFKFYLGWEPETINCATQMAALAGTKFKSKK